MGGAPRPPIMTRPLLLVFVASFGAMTGFYLLLSVVPLYAESVGAGGVGAGLVTGALMAATVAGELAVPRLLARFGYRVLLAAGLVLLGAPALALPASATMAAILLVTLVRGLGFAICVVVGGALVATLVPPERRGEGLGLFGIVVGVPGVAALPLGVWLVGWTGYPPVFVAGAVAALAGLAVVRWAARAGAGLRGARRGPGRAAHPGPGPAGGHVLGRGHGGRGGGHLPAPGRDRGATEPGRGGAVRPGGGGHGSAAGGPGGSATGTGPRSCSSPGWWPPPPACWPWS